MKSSNTRSIAFGGVLSSLLIILIVLSSYIPTNRLSIFFIMSLIGMIIIFEFNTFLYMLVFVCVSALGFLMMGNKVLIVPYVSFFGIYPLVKLFIEKLNRLALEFVIKIIFFVVVLSVSYIIWGRLLIPEIKSVKDYLWIIPILSIILFILYDILLSKCMDYYNYRLRKYIRRLK